MTRIWLTGITFLLFHLAYGQPKTAKKTNSAVPSQAEINKMMEDAMKAQGMSKEEQAQMKDIMKNAMPAMMEASARTADYPDFTSNKELVPKKDPARISKMRRIPLSQAEVSTYAGGLLSKIMTKAPAAELALIKRLSTGAKAADMEAAAIEAMLQGHPEAALGLSMKAVQAAPSNNNYQNNMAAMLTEYGHPDLAMPVLTKLQDSYPGNSTILNNLAYAWLGLGVTDSAKLFAGAAARINPNHPDATLCGGLMDELTGDPIKNYTESMDNAVNPFTEQVINNSGKTSKLNYETIKNSLTIYEYFPYDWMPAPPLLYNDVKHYNENKATVDAWEEMGKKLAEEVRLLVLQYQKGFDNLAAKGETEFVKEMTKEMTGGLSMMSKPATAILKVLSDYQVEFQENMNQELKNLLEWKTELTVNRDREIKKIYDQISDSKGTKCEDYKRRLDELEDEYMQTVNPKFRWFYREKADEMRQWVNAYVTWNWYVVGNPKNMIMMQDLGFVAMLTALYTSIITSSEVNREHCNSKDIRMTYTVDKPTIPNFQCPAVVAFPSGHGFQPIDPGAKNLDINSFDIKTNGPVPNVSVGYGIGETIAQPGVHPFVKTAHGSMTVNQGAASTITDRGISQAYRKAGGTGSNNKGRSAGKKVDAAGKKVIGVSPDNGDGSDADDPGSGNYLAPLLSREDYMNARLANEIIKKMMTADCAKKYVKPRQRYVVGSGTLEMDEVETVVGIVEVLDEESNTVLVYNDKGELVATYEGDIVRVEGGSVEIDGDPTIHHFNRNGELVATSQAEPSPAAKQETESSLQKTSKPDARVAPVMNQLKANVQSVQANGLQPTISNSAQATGPFNFLQNLFK